MRRKKNREQKNNDDDDDECSTNPNVVAVKKGKNVETHVSGNMRYQNENSNPEAFCMRCILMGGNLS